MVAAYVGFQGPPGTHCQVGVSPALMPSTMGIRKALMSVVTLPRSGTSFTSLIFLAYACHWTCFGRAEWNEGVNAIGVPVGMEVPRRRNVAAIARDST